MDSAIRHTSEGSEGREGFFSRVLTNLNTLWVAATYPFAGKGRKLSLHYTSEISRCFAPHIRLGNYVEIGRQTWFFTWPTEGTQGNDEVKITIEDNCRIAARCTITAGNSIHLERDVVLASDVLLMDHAHAYEDVTRPIGEQGTTPGGRIRIGEGCRIGQGAAILCSNKGELVLGRNCWVSPRAVVSRSFPPNSVLSGNPARAVQYSGTTQVSVQPYLGAEIDPAKQGSRGTLGDFFQAFWAVCLRRRSMKESSNRNPEPISYSRRMTRKDPLVWFSRAAGKLRTLWLAWSYPFSSFGKGSWSHYSCHVARSAAPYISIGENVGLARDARLDVCAPLGIDRPVLILEDRCGVGRWCKISARNHIHVMRDVLFGPSVLVMDHGRGMEEWTDPTGQRQGKRAGTIRIEEECWIGCGTVIVCEQGELVIGRHSVVGANSVIKSSIPPYSVVAGDPARIVKQYDFSSERWVLGCIRSACITDRGDPRQPDLRGANSALSVPEMRKIQT